MLIFEFLKDLLKQIIIIARCLFCYATMHYQEEFDSLKN